MPPREFLGQVNHACLTIAKIQRKDDIHTLATSDADAL